MKENAVRIFLRRPRPTQSCRANDNGNKIVMGYHCDILVLIDKQHQALREMY